MKQLAEIEVSKYDLKKIKKLLMRTEGSLYHADIAKKLNLDLPPVVAGCNMLMRKYLVQVLPERTNGKAKSVWPQT